MENDPQTFPANDSRPHVESRMCPCGPIRVYLAGLGYVWRHWAFDCREFWLAETEMAQQVFRRRFSNVLTVNIDGH